MELRAVIFDLDGVITDTAEYHYRAWQRMADEEGLPFNREINEQLRGVSRRASLEIILAGRQPGEDKIEEMMERKNDYYVSMLSQISPADLLPGALSLLHELKQVGIKVAIGSASKNAQAVIEALGIAHLLDTIADGHSVERTKPAPDLFLAAARQMGVPPSCCAVVEDAAAGVDAALAAGMWAVGLGPADRVGHAHARFESLAEVSLADLLAALDAACWTVREIAIDPGSLHHKETIFTVGNGYLCARGALEEGFPGEMPGSFVHRLWDDMPINYTELANIPRWWGVDIWVNNVRFRLDRGRVESYHRRLDLRTGVLLRTVRWRPGLEPANSPLVEFEFARFVSMADQHLAVVRARITMLEGEADVRIRTGLDAHVENTGLLHWTVVDQNAGTDEARLLVRTRATEIDLALVAAFNTEGSRPETSITCDADGQPMVERRIRLNQGESYVLENFLGVVSSNESPDPMHVAAATAQTGLGMGYSAAYEANAAEWRKLWETSDVLVDGDFEAQVALRFNIFQLLIAAPRYTDRASIGAKTLSGFGYRHHVFWDTEIFMLPFFTFTQPLLARNMLMYRWHNLPGARAKAAANGYEGAQFPWESAGTGQEVTPVWVPHFADPHRLVRIWTGDIEIHITADIAYASIQYWRVTGDDAWMRDHGAEIVLDGAKFWASAASLEEDHKYHYRNVIGPDEYHDRVDDNAFTNVMAKWHLETALDVLAWLDRTYPDKGAELRASLDLNEARLAHWSDVIGCMYLPVDPETGLMEQFAGYFDLEDANIAELRDAERRRSMQALLGIEECAHTQILKQPDVLMLQFLLPGRFSEEQVRVNYDYYDPRTDHEHGSSLGPSISSVMASRVGDSAVAYEHFMRAARADLLDVRHNAGDGIHGANAGGLWQAAVFGFAGLKVLETGWETQPRLPNGWRRLAFNFLWRGELQRVDVRPEVGEGDCSGGD